MPNKVREILDKYIRCGEEEICNMLDGVCCGKGRDRRSDKDDYCILIDQALKDILELLPKEAEAYDVKPCPKDEFNRGWDAYAKEVKRLFKEKRS